MTATKKQPWRRLGLTDEEYALIEAALGREPNPVELNIYSVMWSEHCSYKHSRDLLRLLPSEGPAVLQGPGENAGVVDLGEGWAAAFKIESHNHPSAVEPFMGAATGAGGIIRDIIAMGARPVAMLASLRFGPPGEQRSRYLYEKASAGLDWYCRETEVPVAGRMIYFEESYRGNPLVNVMCAGLLPAHRVMRGRAGGKGNLVLLAGAPTGRDGIHGVTFASDELTAEAEKREHSPVPLGDGARGKALLEATLEVIEKDLVEGAQDLGGAGLSCALTETAARAGTGIDVDLTEVALGEKEMAAREILISESQERMLLITAPSHEQEVVDAFKKRGLSCRVIGRVTEGDEVTVYDRGEEVARVPAGSVADGAPLLRPASREPAYYRELAGFDPSTLPPPEDPGEAFLKVFASPDLAGRIDLLGGDEGVPGRCTTDAVLVQTEQGPLLALALSGNGRKVYLDPYRGSVFAVAEAARRLACTGALTLGITDGLNFGNPEKPEIFWQFRRSVEGIAAACQALHLPVVGGNVSFYNEVAGEAIYPTPVIGALGVLETPGRYCGAGFSREKEQIYLVGSSDITLGGSLYLKAIYGKAAGALPPIDLDLEKRLQELLRRLIGEALPGCIHSLGDGGLAVALAESALLGGQGAEIALPGDPSPEGLLFGEGPTRVLLAVKEGSPEKRFLELARAARIPVILLGRSGGDRLHIAVGASTAIDLPLSRLRQAHEEATAWMQQ